MATGLQTEPHVNGTSAKSVNGENGTSFPERDRHSLVLSSFRCLVADIVQQFDGGHPG